MVFMNTLWTFTAFIVCDARLFKRARIHPLPNWSLSHDVTDPAGTVASLDMLTSNVTSWAAGQSLPVAASNTTTGSSQSGSTPVSGVPADSTSTDTTDSQLQEITNQANDGFAKVTGSMQINEMTLDLLRLNVSKLERDVKRNITRIDGLLQDLGDISTNGVASTAVTFSQQLASLQTDVASLKASAASGDGSTDNDSSRIDDLGKSVSSIDARVTALERSTTLSSAAQSSATTAPTTTTPYDSTTLQAVLQSWTGRIALAACLIGIVALVLASIAFSRLPKKEDSNGAEEVLLETQAVEEQPVQEEEEVYAEEGEEVQA